MKRKKIIVGRIGFIAIGLFLLSLYLKETFQYAFFNREQQQLFLFDSDYVSGLLLQPGGVALCLSRFLVQFFYSTVWSVSLTALLLLSIILASMGILRKLGGKWFLAPLAFCPAGTLTRHLMGWTPIRSTIKAAGFRERSEKKISRKDFLMQYPIMYRPAAC